MQSDAESRRVSNEFSDQVTVPIQGRWIGTDNVTFSKENFQESFMERIDRKHPKIPLISEVVMVDGYILENLKIKPERMCYIYFESGKDAAIALSIQFVHVIVRNHDGMKKAYLVSLSIPGHNLVMQNVYSVIWKNLSRLEEINQELKEVGAIRLSGLKEPLLSSDRDLRQWYKKELTKIGQVLKGGGVCSMIKRKFVVASDRSKGHLLKNLVEELHKEECLIIATLQQLQTNGIVFEFEVPYEI